MAIIVDPDDLDRNQVIFGTEGSPRRQSVFPVGAAVAGTDPEIITGETPAGGGAGTGTFQDTINGAFIASGVLAGQILSIKSGQDAGHYNILGVNSATVLAVELPTDRGVRQSVWRDTSLVSGVYDIRANSGGSIVDGLTEQADYSFAKEEWRNDPETYADDDLIQHPFPYEPITREQFEIGGGTAHALWDWHSDDSRERIRTGGWAIVSGTTTQYEYAGVITLGTLDTDARVYYQQSGTHGVPLFFVLSGTVNQAVQSFDSLGFDNRSYLKVLVRKKARSYEQSELSDIGVTTLEALVNRFPLTHATDPAISADDAEIEGHDPWTNFSILDSGSNGVTADIGNDQGTFTAAGENFDTSGLAAGDVIEITGGTNDNGFFEIVSVDTATQLTLDTEEHGAFSGESSLTYETHTRFIQSGGARLQGTDGVLADVDGDTGTLTSAAGGFSGTVAASDVVRITEADSDFRGVYLVVSQDSDTQLTLNTEDQNFTGTPLTSIDFDALEPGMYLQFKEVDVDEGTPGNLTFNANAVGEDSIERTTENWAERGTTVGDQIDIAGSTNNDGCYTIGAITGTHAYLVATDSLTQEGPVAATPTVTSLFKRTINDIVYGFHWRTFGNAAGTDSIFEFVQRELRSTDNIDNGPNFDGARSWDRGDVTDLLMTFASPTAVGLDMYIDNFDPNDANDTSFEDACGVSRAPSFISAGTITFNDNLQGDASAVYRMFFSDPDGTPGNGDEYGSVGAILVNDSNGNPISGNVGGASSVTFDFDYDGNTQGGRTPATDAVIVLVAIGLATAQFVRHDNTITRATGLTFALSASLERNYST